MQNPIALISIDRNWANRLENFSKIIIWINDWKEMPDYTQPIKNPLFVNIWSVNPYSYSAVSVELSFIYSILPLAIS